MGRVCIFLFLCVCISVYRTLPDTEQACSTTHNLVQPYSHLLVKIINTKNPCADLLRQPEDACRGCGGIPSSTRCIRPNRRRTHPPLCVGPQRKHRCSRGEQAQGRAKAPCRHQNHATGQNRVPAHKSSATHAAANGTSSVARDTGTQRDPCSGASAQSAGGRARGGAGSQDAGGWGGECVEAGVEGRSGVQEGGGGAACRAEGRPCQLGSCGAGCHCEGGCCSEGAFALMCFTLALAVQTYSPCLTLILALASHSHCSSSSKTLRSGINDAPDTPLLTLSPNGAPQHRVAAKGSRHTQKPKHGPPKNPKRIRAQTTRSHPHVLMMRATCSLLRKRQGTNTPVLITAYYDDILK